jgi:hypothetical protein
MDDVNRFRFCENMIPVVNYNIKKKTDIYTTILIIRTDLSRKGRKQCSRITGMSGDISLPRMAAILYIQAR